MALDVDANPQVGATFLPGDPGPLFRFVVDKTTVIGPRPATEGDRTKYPGAWAHFVAEHPDAAFNGADASKFDHDGKGGAGGSPKGGVRRRKAT
jgi:hypothetical protein